MAVPEALCIIFACPVVTILLSAILLGDNINLVKVLAGSMLVLGVILVCQPAFLFTDVSLGTVEKDDLYYLGVFLAGTACLASGLMDVLVAKCEDVSASVLLLWTALSGLAISVIYCLSSPQSQILSGGLLQISWQDWALYLGEVRGRSCSLILRYFLSEGLALSGLLAFATLTKSLQLISPNLVASIRTLELVLAFLVQSLLTGLSPSLPSCLGGGAILSGVLLLASQQNILWASRKLGTVVKEQLRKLRLSFSNYEEQQEGEESRLLSSFITDTATITST